MEARVYFYFPNTSCKENAVIMFMLFVCVREKERAIEHKNAQAVFPIVLPSSIWRRFYRCYRKNCLDFRKNRPTVWVLNLF